MRIVFLLLVVMMLAIVSEGRFLSISKSDSRHQGKKKSSSISNEDHLMLVSSTSVIENNRRGQACILGGALAHLAFGTLYCWANFMPYAPANLRFFDGVNRAGPPDSLIVMPLIIIAQCITLPISPYIVKQIGASKAMILGSIIMSAGVYLSSYAKSLYVFLLFYALTFGIGVGIAYTAPMTAGYKWLPNSKGLVSGGILAGYGIGGFIFNMIGTKLINPKGANPVNGRFPEEVYAGFSPLLRKLAVMYFAVTMIGSLLVTEPKVENAGKNDQAPGVSVVEALKTKQFWLLWAMVLSAASAGLNVATVYKQFASSAPALAGDSFQALVGACGAIFNGAGRLFWGLASDKIGFKAAFMIMTFLQTILQLVYPYSAAAKPFFLAFTCACYFCLAGIFALMPPATQRLFGARNGQLLYGLLYSAFGVAAIGGQVLSKTLLAKLGWVGAFSAMAAISFLATILTSTLTPLTSFAASTV